MHKDEVQKHIVKHLAVGDELIGFFQATYTPSFWWFLLVGPLMFMGVRVYFVGVSKQGLYFYRLTFMGKFRDADFFTYDEIESAKVGEGILARPMVFRFKNGKKLKVKGQLKGVEKVATLTPEVSDYLRSNIAAPK